MVTASAVTTTANAMYVYFEARETCVVFSDIILDFKIQIARSILFKSEPPSLFQLGPCQGRERWVAIDVAVGVTVSVDGAAEVAI